MRKFLALIFAVALTLGTTGLAFATDRTDSARADSARADNARADNARADNALPADNGGVDRLEQRLSGEVRHQLAMIPQVTVFDNLAYKVEGGTVTLYGEVRNAVISDVAEKSVKRLEGVERVDNKIEVLPA